MLPVFFLLALSAAAPLAEEPAFVDAVALYDELELEQAVLRFQELALDEGRSADERAEILVWLGLTYAQLGRFDDASRQFGLAVRARRDVELPRPAGDKVRLLLEDARKTAPVQAAPDDPRETEEEADAPPEKAADDEPKKSPLPTILRISSLVAAGVAGVGVAGASVIAFSSVAWFININNDPNATQVDVADVTENANSGLIVAAIIAGSALPVAALAGVLYGSAMILEE